MQNSGAFLFIILGIGIFVLLAGVLIFRLLYNRYLNKRLKGEVEKRTFFNYKAFVIIMGFCVCAFFISFLATTLAQAKITLDYYTKIYDEKISPRQIEITDFERLPEYKEYCDALMNDTLSGYEVTLKTDGDFECYVGLPKGTIKKDFFMPQYFIYVRYVGEELEDMQMERLFFYDEDEHGYGGMGNFEPEILLVGNSLETDFYLCIKTIIKITPRTAETKANWNSIPVHTQSRFVVTI